MNKLKLLIAVRHCQDRSGDTLSPFGLEQANRLAAVIKDTYSPNGATVVLSSPTGRTKMTGDIVAKHIGAEMIIVDELELDYHQHGERQLEAIEQFLTEAEIAIVITHFEAPSGIVSAVSRRLIGVSHEAQEVHKGSGFVLDCVTGKVTKIP